MVNIEDVLIPIHAKPHIFQKSVMTTWIKTFPTPSWVFWGSTDIKTSDYHCVKQLCDPFVLHLVFRVEKVHCLNKLNKSNRWVLMMPKLTDPMHENTTVKNNKTKCHCRKTLQGTALRALNSSFSRHWFCWSM